MSSKNEIRDFLIINNFFLFDRFHDIDGIADFIILKQHYDQALQREWKNGI